MTRWSARPLCEVRLKHGQPVTLIMAKLRAFTLGEAKQLAHSRLCVSAPKTLGSAIVSFPPKLEVRRPTVRAGQALRSAEAEQPATHHRADNSQD